MRNGFLKVAADFLILLGGLSALAQTTVTTTGGTTNAVPKFSGSGTIVNSSITETNGAVAIDALQPYGILTVAPPVFVPDGQSTPANGIVFADRVGSTDQWSHAAIYSMGAVGYNGNLIFATDGDGVENFNPTEKMRIDPFGMIGMGTAAPRSRLDIWKGALSVTGTDTNGTAYVTSQGGTAFFGDNTLGNGLAVNYLGNVGVGTANPGGKLEVNGGITLSSGSNGVITFADGQSNRPLLAAGRAPASSARLREIKPSLGPLVETNIFRCRTVQIASHSRTMCSRR